MDRFERGIGDGEVEWGVGGSSLDVLRDLVDSRSVVTEERLGRVSEWLMEGQNVRIFEDGTVIEAMAKEDLWESLRTIELLGELGSYNLDMSVVHGPNGPMLAVDTLLSDFVPNDTNVPNVVKAMARMVSDVMWMRYHGRLSQSEGYGFEQSRAWAARKMQENGRESIEDTIEFMGGAQQYLRERTVGVLDTEEYGEVQQVRVAEGLIGVFQDEISERLLGYMVDENSEEGKMFLEMMEKGEGMDVGVGVMHGMKMMEYCRRMFDIDVSKMTLHEQTNILRFLGKKSTGDVRDFVGRLKNVHRKAEGEEKFSYEMFVRSFIAVEFGEDFGERLLKIAEMYDGEDVGRVLGAEAKMREAGEVVAGWVNRNGEYDELAGAVGVAFVKRTTELLAVVANGDLSEEEREEAIRALEIVGWTADVIAKSGGKLGEIISDRDDDFVTTKSSDGMVTQTIRADENSGLRLGWTVKVPKELLPEGATSKDKRMNMRLDYDEMGLALDIGSSGKRSDVAVFVGEALAKGEKELARDRGEEVAGINGHHVREAFAGLSMGREEFARMLMENFLGGYVEAEFQIAKNALRRVAAA